MLDAVKNVCKHSREEKEEVTVKTVLCKKDKLYHRKCVFTILC